jgi:predicted DNA-binding protein (MmcQ/YjbR family)
MFCVTGLDSPEAGISLKCTPEVFAELTELDGITPAPLYGTLSLGDGRP